MSKREHNTSPLLPSGYRQLEYIECTGTQYINTGITGYNEHWKYFFSVKLNNDYILTHGQYNQAANNGRIMSLIVSSLQPGYVTRFDYACGGGYTVCDVNPISVDNWIDCYEDFSTLTVNESTYSLTKYTRTSTVRMLLFAHWFGGSSWTYSKGKCRQATIWDNNGILKFDGYSALRISDSKPGLYDLVNNQFYTNAGSGEFLYN